MEWEVNQDTCNLFGNYHHIFLRNRHLLRLVYRFCNPQSTWTRNNLDNLLQYAIYVSRHSENPSPKFATLLSIKKWAFFILTPGQVVHVHIVAVCFDARPLHQPLKKPDIMSEVLSQRSLPKIIKSCFHWCVLDEETVAIFTLHTQVSCD